ncbi:glycosyltransferase family 2 protein [Paenibacillus sp. PK3_47]|uniref:glycosyltransferase family 2 protein n=1 Tax=Paenibacillus sp. PK3_47 TaxID=2072642 RepID=UPI00201DA2D8|nr:glycosyltransferase [Paenibacillus sp. PK3_47]UQZ36849.1 glycosyltransferase family 2 protein [Paenibacillus sp. PK3_47]
MADVGVVMPVYIQNPEFLRQALESVLKQTITGFRLVIVIDGAPQMEPLVTGITGRDPRITVISYPVNQGVAHALNTGFKLLFEDPDIRYLTWVSTDNIYESYFLEILRAALVKGPPELGLVYSSFQSIDNEGNLLNDEHQLAALRQYQGRNKEMLLESSIIGVSFMYKADPAKIVGDYRLQPVEDYDYWLRLEEHCDIRYIPVELMKYRVNSSFSVSAQLLSTENHRKWRYTYHLTRLQARSRRGIPPAITILYPVQAADASHIAAVENIYEQTFSNYIFRVLDLSHDNQPTALLSEIHHPITEFVWMPGASVQHAVYRMLVSITTPYTLLFGPGLFTSYMDIEYLIDNLIRNTGTVISDYYTDDHTQIGYRHKGVPSVKPTLTNELFKTAELLELYSQTMTQKILSENE